ETARFDLLGGTTLERALPGRAVWFTPGGKEIGVALQSGVVRFLDPATGAEARRFGTGKPFREDCPGVAPSPDGKLLTVVDPKDEKTLALLDMVTGREVRRIAGPDKLEAVAFSPDSATLAVSDSGSAVRLFEVATGKEQRSIASGAPRVFEQWP